MREQYKVILETPIKAGASGFTPAFEVKRQRKFPTEYRKRCSELVKMGMLKNIGPVVIDGHTYGHFVVTAKGRKAIQ